MAVYTKKGDGGETSLYGGARIKKSGLRVWCYGTVDEANSALGLAYSHLCFEDLKSTVRAVQQKLFILGAELASSKEGIAKLKERIVQADIDFLEKKIDGWTGEVGDFHGFVTPGDTVASSFLHVARTAVRRAERYVTQLNEEEEVAPELLKYLNRLSDALFVMAQTEVYKSVIKLVVDKVQGKTEKSNTLLSGGLFDKLRAAVSDESRKMGVPVSFALVDKAGILQYFCRSSDAILASLTISQNKAYTAAILKVKTSELYDDSQPGGSLYGINMTDPRIVVFGGGFPLCVNGEVIGAIGISGGSVEEDERIGARVLAEFENYSKG
jgi:ATP:cob(I)alamin adenosyltransferase